MFLLPGFETWAGAPVTVWSARARCCLVPVLGQWTHKYFNQNLCLVEREWLLFQDAHTGQWSAGQPSPRGLRRGQLAGFDTYSTLSRACHEFFFDPIFSLLPNHWSLEVLRGEGGGGESRGSMVIGQWSTV